MASHGEEVACKVVVMDFGGARTGREISWRGQKRAVLGATGNHDRVHDPLFTKKANANNISFPHSLAGSSACAVHS